MDAVLAVVVVVVDVAAVVDCPGGANIGLIDTVACCSLDAGYHVVLEGVLCAYHYGQMLTTRAAKQWRW